MPIVETNEGEAVSVVGRRGLNYVALDGSKYFVDGEMVCSDDYDYAVYNTITIGEDTINDPLKIEFILYRIYQLSKIEPIIMPRLRFFDDNNTMYTPKKVTFTFSPKDSETILIKNNIGRILENENVNALKDMIDIRPYILKNFVIGYYGETLLHFFANKGSITLCKALLDMGMNVDEEGFEGATPLGRACSKADINLVKFFINNKARVNGLDYGVSTPLMLAVMSGNKEIVQYLINKGAEK